MRRYYIAGPYGTRHELRDRRTELLTTITTAQVTSRWLDEIETTTDLDTAAWPYAVRDFADIDAADTLISFTGMGGRGGRHVEYGYAIARGLRLVIIGPREHIFHTAPHAQVTTWDEFLRTERDAHQ